MDSWIPDDDKQQKIEVKVHGVHHDLQGRIDNRSCVLRVQPLDQGSRTFQVRKQGGDGFTLAVTCSSRFHCGLLR